MLTINNFAGTDALVVRVAGDSITQGGTAGGQSPGEWGWPDAPGGLFESISPSLALKSGPSSSTRQGVATLPLGGVVTLKPGAYPAVAQATLLKPAQLLKVGQGGSPVTIVTNWASGHPEVINEAQYKTFFPGRADLFIIAWSINDYVSIQNGTYGGSGATVHITAYAALLDRLHADYPGAQILCLGCLFISEAWSSSGGNHYTGGGGIPNSNPFDINNIVDQNIRTCVAARPGWTEYCSLVDQALAFTVANEPEPGPVGGWPGLLSMNGLHPTLLGQQKMGAWVAAHLNFVTT